MLQAGTLRQLPQTAIRQCIVYASWCCPMISPPSTPIDCEKIRFCRTVTGQGLHLLHAAPATGCCTCKVVSTLGGSLLFSRGVLLQASILLLVTTWLLAVAQPPALQAGPAQQTASRGWPSPPATLVSTQQQPVRPGPHRGQVHCSAHQQV